MPMRKLGRRSDVRKMLLRNQVTSFLHSERFVTTEAKAKEVSAIAEHLITMAREDNINTRRQAAAYLLDEDVTRKLFVNIAPKYKDRQGGYTRVVRLGQRRGDAAPMAVLELV
ncbi:MAG: 50S ribosomal protein L17 [Thermaerobacter sp.]|nr:50S ribosomal protein L17 [Thermaerobacter sp.]